ncbi:TIGR03118 family protein [Janthinobacterium sp.]|uniref:TIGR03118 family protein n=1 Tax=Janthinobacterium sp. TaxID=1871054 RepID=UPI00293D4A49|nr:TIGR03118 family protein [Janthinobacterium sp.]
MRQTAVFSRAITARLCILALAGLIGACGGSSHHDDGIHADTVYAVAALVSDGAAPAAHTDVNLQNAWGIAFNPNGVVWVNNNKTNTSTLYDGNGVPQSLVVSIPAGASGDAAPTGIAFNASSDFVVSQGGQSGKSVFLFVGEGGTISGWAPGVNATNAVTAVDTGVGGANYKGMALASYAGANYLYAADIRHRRIDVYDASFGAASLPGGFTDPGLPADYAPFNIVANGARLYIAYAQFTPPNEDENKGAGLGIVSVFDTGGNFIKRLVTGGRLNAPWGMAFAPADFPGFPSAMLVGNFGDGWINAYSPDTGAWLGALKSDADMPIAIDGLWGIGFGNGLNSQPLTTLFFAAGPNDEAHGVYGRLDGMPR